MAEPYARSAEEILQVFGVTAESGLDEAEAARRRRQHGPNRLQHSRGKPLWRILLDQFNSIIVWLLAAAAALSVAFGEWEEATAIVAVLLINAAIGFITELKARRSMQALRRIARVTAKLRRSGAVSEIPAEEIVPGDIVVLESGDVVAADLRLLAGNNLQCDESALTGESVPVSKSLEALAGDTPLAERRNMAFKGTAVTRGSGLGVAVATGMASELGHIASLVSQAEEETSPLEKRLDRLGGQLVWATVAITVIIAAAGTYGGKDILVMVQTAIALAVAAVPEGLPIVATVALARGMLRMARRNALIEKLGAVETLGATTVILTDKTGTLTENRMQVVQLLLESGPVRIRQEQDGTACFLREERPFEPRDDAPTARALRVAALCSGAALSEEGRTEGRPLGSGDPMELALLAAGLQGGFDRDQLLQNMPQVREEAFSTETKMMATFHRLDAGQKEDAQAGGRFFVAVKGAPEAVLQHCTHTQADGGAGPFGEAERQRWRKRNEALAGEGLRILALACKQAQSSEEAPYDGLTFLGLVGLHDPPRADVADAIAACRGAGVRVIMLTGDHAATARAIAATVGLVEAPDATAVDARDLADLSALSEGERRGMRKAAIFSRINPKAKLDVVALHQEAGAVVAMTGDGVNDAPALKKADIGIAMGRRGTQVAREAADMVLRDDAFPSIVAAMEQGRVIFANIRRFVLYLMSCNLSEIMVIGLATIGGLPLPLLPLQILYLNLVTDVFPAFALGIGEGSGRVMNGPPQDPRAAILDRRRWAWIGLYGTLITAATLCAFVLALFWLRLDGPEAVTIAFATLALAQLWHVFNMRDNDAGMLRNDVTGNRYVWAALVLCVALTVGAIYLPGLSTVLALSDPGMAGWMLALAASLAPLAGGQLAKELAHRLAAGRHRSVAARLDRRPAHPR